jgi:small subunit ribosomal protein S20
MPITSSAKKALRQNLRRRAMNRKRKDSLTRAIKEYKKLVAAKRAPDAAQSLPRVYKVIDKIAKAGTIKKNKASRLKSRLARELASLTK